MYMKIPLHQKSSLIDLIVTNDESSTDNDPGVTETTQVPPEFTSSIGVTSTEVTTISGDEDEDKKWVLPLIITLACLLFLAGLAVIAIIYRKRDCFGLPLPFRRRKIQLARPIMKIADSVRSSISSTFSISDRSALGGNNRQFDKYAVRLDKIVEGASTDNAAVVNDLDWIKEKSFAGEFEAVKRADQKDVPTTAALKLENVLRNRFSNVLPYDKTRVVLTAGASGNDYVNASYISGFRKEQEFICTQGPLKHTVADFWQMCWETRATAIVMLTKCYEKNQEKCYPYWPSGNSGYSYFGDIKVTLEKKTAWRLKDIGGQQNSDQSNFSTKDHLWLVSELVMEKEERTQKIIHIVFLSWPDFGVVDPPSSLVAFVRHVQQLVENNNTKDDAKKGPTIVHCCAGVGRSGVYIAVDQIIRQLDSIRENKGTLKATGKVVNIFQTVVKMRRERMGMVQNLLQYTLIYKCLRVLVGASATGNEDDMQPTMVSTDLIQGSDWGLIYPDSKLSKL